MKKILAIVSMAAMVAGAAFAADAKGSVYMTGNVASGTVDTYADGTDSFAVNGPSLAKQNQKDADAIVWSFSGEKAGANFQFWYKYTGSGADAVQVRSANVWFKPLDMVKVTVGDLSTGTYKERIEWWKVPCGSSAANFNAWSHKWSSYATVEGAGAEVEVTPIAGLTINAGIAPGTTDTDNKIYNYLFAYTPSATTGWGYKAYGAYAKYQIMEGVTAAVSLRDEGYDAAKIAAIGADYSNSAMYGFLNARFFMNKDTFSKKSTIDRGSGITETATKGVTLDTVELTGVCLDNYINYNFGFMKLEGRFPVTIRGIADPTVTVSGTTYNFYEESDKNGYGSKNDYDPSYMTFGIKASFPLASGYTPYLFIYDDDAIVFNDTLADVFHFSVKPGVTFSVGECALDIAALVNVPNKTENLTWSVPFTARVSF